MSKCPGESQCDDWAQPRPDGESYEEKVENVCRGCPKFESKPAYDAGETEIPKDEIDDVVDDIADMIFLEKGGALTDWTQYPIDYYRLFCSWRDAESDVEEMRQRNIQSLIKSL
jgi:hypothetical protein